MEFRGHCVGPKQKATSIFHGWKAYGEPKSQKQKFMGILFSCLFAYVCHKLSHGIFVHTLLYFIMSILLCSRGNSCGISWISWPRAAAVDVSFLNCCAASASLAYLKTLSVNCCDKSKKRENIANECGRTDGRPDEGHRCVWATLRRRPNETSWA